MKKKDSARSALKCITIKVINFVTDVYEWLCTTIMKGFSICIDSLDHIKKQRSFSKKKKKQKKNNLLY